MFDPISPQKENIVSNADVLKISSDTKKYIPAFSTSPKSMNVAPNAGKKIEDTTKFIQLEASENDQSAEKPRFPIRIPIDQMKPKKNYLGLLKSDSFTEKKMSSTNKSQKSSRTEKPTKTVPSQSSQRIRTKVPQDLPVGTKGKPQSHKRTEYLKSNNTLSERNDSFNESRNLKKSSEPRINDHLRTSHQSLEMNKAYGEKPKLSKNRASSTNRPASSRSFHNVKNKPLDEIRRSSELHPREKDNSRFGQEFLAQEMVHSEENKKELIKRTKMIITENLKKYHEQMKESKENLEKIKEEKKALKEKTQHMNQEIKEKNKLRNHSGSPVKHKYGWGVDQKRLEMKPESRGTAEKWQKKDSPRRREEIGLAHLNNLDEETVKKARTGWKQNIENKIRESEEKYKKKRTDKSPDEKDKIKKIIDQQFKKKQNEKRKNSAAKLQEEKKKKERLESLTKNIEEIRAKDQAEAEKHKTKPKKARKPFRVLDNDRSHHSPEEQDEHDYEEEDIEEEVVEKPKKLKSSRISSTALKSACGILNSTLVKPALKDALSHWRRKAQRPNRQQESVKKANKNSQITPQKIDSEIPSKSAGKTFKTEQKVSYREEELVAPKERNQSEGRNLKSAAKTPAKEVISAKKSLSPTAEKKQQQQRPDFHENDDVFITDKQAEVIMKSQEYKKLFGHQKSGGKQTKIEHFEQDIDTHLNPRDLEGKDFDDMLFNLSSEELIRLPYFSIAK